MSVNYAWKARLVYLVVVLAIPSITAALVWNIVSDSFHPSTAPLWAAFIFMFMMWSTATAGAVLYGHVLFEAPPTDAKNYPESHREQ